MMVGEIKPCYHSLYPNIKQLVCLCFTCEFESLKAKGAQKGDEEAEALETIPDIGGSAPTSAWYASA